VHTGEVETIAEKVSGITVIIGARIAAQAGPSEVLVSRTVIDLVGGSGLRSEDAGEHELKGVPERWRLYWVISGDLQKARGAIRFSLVDDGPATYEGYVAL
jgi:class 3 adenylate cyclase